LTEITGERADFASLKPQIKGELIFQKAQALFVEKAEGFSNMVYEQADSLQPAAKAFGGQVQVSDWSTREDINKFSRATSWLLRYFQKSLLKSAATLKPLKFHPTTW